MAKVISVINQKGGVGKSTLSFNLAYCFSVGLKVGIVDADVQGTVKSFEDMMKGIELISLDKLPTLSIQPYDVILVDTPPYLSDKLDVILDSTDFVLIPIKPSYVDAMAVRPTIDLISKKRSSKPDLQAGIVFNMVKPRTSVNQDVLGIVADLSVPTLNTTVSDRIAFVRSIITNGVFGGDDERAIKEVTDLAEEILDKLGL